MDYVACYASCAVWGTVRQTPLPTVSELGVFYPADYHAQTGQGLLNRVRQQMRLRRLQPLLEGEGALLDYGCGTGAFLFHAGATVTDRDLYGFEIAETTEIIRKGNITIVKGDLEDLLEVLPPCRLITMNHVIEHLRDPADTLSRLSEKLLRGGVVEGQTPAAGSLSSGSSRACGAGTTLPVTPWSSHSPASRGSWSGSDSPAPRWRGLSTPPGWR